MNLDLIKLGLLNPPLLARKLSQWTNYLRMNADFNRNGIDFMNSNWDNMILLDACRYDIFEEKVEIQGDLQKVESRGSATPEFLRGNFRDREFHDTVYVTTNPMLYRHRDDINVSFYDIVNLWSGDTWDEEEDTVLPEVVKEEAMKTAERYPKKRLLIHFMQPHYPFIGSEFDFDQGHIGTGEPEELTTWMKIMTGRVNVDQQTLWEAYAKNLDYAIGPVEQLAETLHGNTVITSDHGNMFGERASPIPYREWGHPPGIWTEELVKVPWLEYPSNGKKEIVSEPPVDSKRSDGDSVKERLESLGYV